MTVPSKAALREAVIVAIATAELCPSQVVMEDGRIVNPTASAVVLRSWLASGLTEPEREQVRKVRNSILRAAKGGSCLWERWLAALSAVVDGKEEDDGQG
jgi:hypothetical protein